ncbi:GreA/GreB family elongation factor [Salmonirosea aquatica]|uniref:Transcription elongation factor GreA n=1 Tax=Salmonirosea aquatica TaxID=2654236 RepID=A0A7C9FYF7_9BACT|nr:transcription elongation factor GreA [Cytophagaceae bacterium SJW1-29]
MSRAFVKEGDQEEVPIIPPRAFLPPGVTNYVTPAGYEQLLKEQAALQTEKDTLSLENETEQRIAAAVLNGKLQLLQERINSAVLLTPDDTQRNAVRFGATVTLKVAGKIQQFQIVGVDEADIQKQKIAFVAPIAVAVTGKKVGEVAELRLGREVRKLEIQKITW